MFCIVHVEIRLAPPPTFNNTTITDCHPDTTYSSSGYILRRFPSLLDFFKSTDGFRAKRIKQSLVKPLHCVHAKIKKNRQIDGHMLVVLASFIKQYLPKRYSHFFFSSNLHYNDWGWAKFYHVEFPPATRLPGENPL